MFQEQLAKEYYDALCEIRHRVWGTSMDRPTLEDCQALFTEILKKTRALEIPNPK